MAALVERISADADAAMERHAPQLEKVNVDSEIITLTIRGQEFTVVFSEEYGQSCSVYGPEDFEVSCRGTVQDITASVLRSLEAPISPLKRARSASEGSVAGSEDSIAPVVDMAHDDQVFAELRQDIADLERHGARCIVRAVVTDGVASVTLSVPIPRSITKSTAEAWGLRRDQPLCLAMEVTRTHYKRQKGASRPLAATIYQGEKTAEGFEPLAAGVQLRNIVRDFWPLVCDGQAQDQEQEVACGRRDTGRLREKKARMMACSKSHRGVLQPLVVYLQGRLPCLHEFCVICDRPLFFPPLLRPTVCTRTLCCFSARTFGDAVTGEFTGQSASLEVWDLLTSMAICAGRMNLERMRILFTQDYFPTLFEPGCNQPAFKADDAGYQKLCTLLDELQRYRAAEASSGGIAWLNTAFGKTPQKAAPLVSALLGWIWESNRSYIVALPSEERISALQTDFQYLLLSAAPEQEEDFQQLKQRHKSRFLFHGSGAANWHTILRQGLKNASNTKLMTCGAAHGAGIYLSSNSGTSAHYSHAHHSQAAQAATGPGALWAAAAAAAGAGPRGTPRQQAAFISQLMGTGGYPAAPPPVAPPVAPPAVAPPVAAAPPPAPLGRQVTGQRLHDPNALVILAICEVANVPEINRTNNGIVVCPTEAAVVTRFLLVYGGRAVPQVNLDGRVGEQLARLTQKYAC